MSTTACTPSCSKPPRCAAALGGVYLRVVWDTDVSDKPWLDMVPPDAAIPEFRYDRLVAVTFWTVLEDHGKTVVRHLEKHIPHQNVILHGVFEGDQQKLGRRVDLGGFEQTAPLGQPCRQRRHDLPARPARRRLHRRVRAEHAAEQGVA